jgi:hypothetical protein
VFFSVSGCRESVTNFDFSVERAVLTPNVLRQSPQARDIYIYISGKVVCQHKSNDLTNTKSQGQNSSFTTLVIY